MAICCRAWFSAHLSRINHVKGCYTDLEDCKPLALVNLGVPGKASVDPRSGFLFPRSDLSTTYTYTTVQVAESFCISSSGGLAHKVVQPSSSVPLVPFVPLKTFDPPSRSTSMAGAEGRLSAFMRMSVTLDGRGLGSPSLAGPLVFCWARGEEANREARRNKPCRSGDAGISKT